MNYRSATLLSLAQHAPCCFQCGKHNSGNVVAAHSNQLRDGKGRGLKASDYRVAFICDTCHHEIDQGKNMTKAERNEAWEEAHRSTIGWLFDNGFITVNKKGAA